MTPDPTTIPSGKTAIDALRLMTDGRCRHLPPVDGGKVGGIGYFSIIAVWNWTSSTRRPVYGGGVDCCVNRCLSRDGHAHSQFSADAFGTNIDDVGIFGNCATHAPLSLSPFPQSAMVPRLLGRRFAIRRFTVARLSRWNVRSDVLAGTDMRRRETNRRRCDRRCGHYRRLHLNKPLPQDVNAAMGRLIDVNVADLVEAK